MQKILTMTAVLTGGLATTAARADFIVKGQQRVVAAQAASGPPGIVADTPHIDPGDRNMPATAKPPAPVRHHLVAGFGNDVPLSFACRQIVPSRIKVSYGPGADPGMRVTWKGGQTWPLVLGTAITPLGLRMVWSGENFSIQR